MASHSILQGFGLCKSCLMVKSERTENLLDMLTQYEILGFYKLGLNRLKL